MKRRQRLVVVLLTLLPLMAFLFWTWTYIRSQVGGVMSHLDVILVDEASRQLNREVKVGSVETSLLGFATIHDLRISNGRTFASGTLLRADEARVRLRLQDLIRGRAPAIQTVDSLRFVRPVILIERLENGRLNVQDIITRRPGPPRPPFLGVIEVQDGKVEFRDSHPSAPGPRPAVVRVKSVDGTFDATNAPAYVYNFTCQGTGGQLMGRLAVSGSMDNTKSLLSTDINASDADARFWFAYFVKPNTVKIERGRADAAFSLTRRIVDHKSHWTYIGTARVRDGAARIVGFNRPATGVRGLVRVTNDLLDLKLSGSMVGTPFDLTGKIASFKKPTLNLDIASRSADFPRLLQTSILASTLKQAVLTGRGPLRVNVVGPTKSLIYTVSASVPQVHALGYRADGLGIGLTYSAGVVHVQHASARALNGKVSAAGSIDLRGGQAKFALAGDAVGVQLGLVPPLRGAGVSGAATGPFTLSGTVARPSLHTTVKVPKGSFNNIALSDAVADAIVTRAGVNLRSLSMAFASGVVNLSGSVGAKRIDLRAEATGINLERAMKALNMTGYGGTGSFSGTIVGPPKNPTVSGIAKVFDGRWEQYRFDYASGQLTATRDEVTLGQAVVRVLPAEVRLSGRISGLRTPTPSVSLDVEVTDAPAERVLSMLHAQPIVSGTVNGKLNVTGTLPAIMAQGSVTLKDGVVVGYPVNEARANIAYSLGTLRLTDVSASSDGTTLTADGSINQAGDLTFTFDAKNIALSRLGAVTRPFAAVSGTMDANGKLGGTVRAPVFSAHVDAVRPIVNTVQLDRISANVSWDGKTVSASDISVIAGAGQLIAKTAGFETVNRTFSVTGGDLRDFSFPSLYTLLLESPYLDSPDGAGTRQALSRLSRPQKGTVTASFAASGPVSSPDATFTLKAGGIDISSIKGAEITLSADVQGGNVAVSDFQLVTSAVTVVATGTRSAAGVLNAEVDAYNLDLSALGPVIGPLPLAGVATIRASVSGPETSPVVMASADVVEPQIFGMTFDRMRASQVTVSQKPGERVATIDISSALLTRDTHGASFSGAIPWEWSTFKVPVDQRISLHGQLEDQTLKVLTIFTSWIEEPRTSGALTATLDLTGTLKHPNLNGQVKVTDGRIGIRSFRNDFTDVQADLVFDGERVTVKALTGSSKLPGATDKSGSFSVEPGGTVSIEDAFTDVPGQPRGSVNLVFHAKDLGLSERNLFGYNEDIVGTAVTADQGITVSGSLLQPDVVGQVSVLSTTAILSAIPAAVTAKPRVFVIDPKFNIRFTLGKDVYFRNPSIIAELRGDGLVGGTLNKPDVKAALTIASGTLRLPTARMRVTSGKMDVAWEPPAAARVMVNLSAQTSLSTLSPSGNRQRYTIVLNVQGNLADLKSDNVVLTSEPPGLSNNQILAALGHLDTIFGTGDVALRNQLSDVLTVAVSPLVFQPLESAFSEALGLEEFNIEYGYQQPLAVYVSRKVAGKVYVSYWRVVTGAPTITGATFSLRLSYRFRDRFDVGWATDSRRVSVIEASYGFRF